MFCHNIRIFSVIFHADIFQDQGLLFTLFWKGHEKIKEISYGLQADLLIQRH